MGKHKMTERGMHLQQCHNNSQGRLREKCKECGLRIRGRDHVNGTHHKIHKAKRMKPSS